MDQRVKTVILIFTEKNCARRLTSSEIARAAGLSPAHLRRVFKAETGFSPMQYLRRLRIHRAQELLETTTLSIKEIAAKIGINDVSHFVRDFEAAFGMSPTTYRARQSSSGLIS